MSCQPLWQVSESDLLAKHEIVSLKSCFPSEGHFSHIYYSVFAKLTRTDLCVASMFFFWRWKKHEKPEYFFFYYVTAEKYVVQGIKGRQFLLSVYSQSWAFYKLNCRVWTCLISPNRVVLFCFMRQTVQQSSLFLYTGGQKVDQDKRWCIASLSLEKTANEPTMLWP